MMVPAEIAAVILMILLVIGLVGFAWFLARTKPPRENRRMTPKELLHHKEGSSHKHKKGDPA